jgi:tetratricopeptide (TPR) repeat protein
MILKLNVSLFLKTGIILFLMGFSQVFAQQDSIDNLLKTEKDSEKKIDILLNSSNYFSGKEIALRLSRQAYQLSLNLNNDELIGQAAKQLFIELYAADKKDSVSFYQEIAIHKFKISHNDNSLFQVLIKKFRFSRNQQKPEVAFEVYKELIVLAEKLDDPLKIAEVYYNMGGLFKDIVAPDKSILYYNKALNLYTKLNNWNGVDDCYLNIGLGYSLKGHYDMAIEYYERGMKIDAEKNNNANSADFLSGIGNVYFALANNKKALDYYKQALACLGKNDNKKAVYLKNNIGVVLMDLEQYKEAKPYLIEVFFSTDDPRTKADYAFNLAQLYEMMGDYKSSIDYMDKYVRMNDSLNSAMYAKNLSESEAKYQNEKKEEQNLN